MERKIMDDLIKWKNDSLKKPFLLYGISGCGKSYSAIEFGKKEYKNTIYFNCANNLELNYVLEKNTTLDKFIRALSAISLSTIFKDESLILFDNVSLNFLKSLLKVVGGVSSYHIILITNSNEIIKNVKSETVYLKKMELVSFPEYLSYIGKDQLIDFIRDSFKNNKPMPFHQMAMETFNDYVLTGGYPNAIVTYRESCDYNRLSNVHEINVNLVKNKFYNLDNLIDIKRSSEIYDNIAIQLLKDNKKFMYGMIKSGARAKEYERAIDFMEENNIIIKSYCIREISSPISKQRDPDSFKIYYNDSGILFNKMNVSANRLLTNDKLLSVLYENNIVSALKDAGYSIYYYHSVGKAFLDFVVQTRNGKIIPMEIIDSGINSKSKSLALTMSKYGLNYAIRFSEENFKEKNGIVYIPYYAAFVLKSLN